MIHKILSLKQLLKKISVAPLLTRMGICNSLKRMHKNRLFFLFFVFFFIGSCARIAYICLFELRITLDKINTIGQRTWRVEHRPRLAWIYYHN